MDVLLGVDIVVDICSKGRAHHSSSSAAYDVAMKNEFHLYLYAGSLQTIYLELVSELSHSMPSLTKSDVGFQAIKTLKEFSKNITFLSALSEDSDDFEDGIPLDNQCCNALKRLGQRAVLLTNNQKILKKAQNTCSPEDFESFVNNIPKTRIPMVDLGKQQHAILLELEKNIHTVLRHGRYIMGPEIGELEEKLAAFAETKHAITCSSGTDALLMPLLAFGVGRGDAIFTSPFTFIATAEVIHLLGATPVFVDIDPQTFNLNPEKLQQTISEVEKEGKLIPKGVIPVDLFGLPSDYEMIEKIAKNAGLFVLEDAAQGFGGQCNGSMAGSFGDCAATSFFPAKPLGCYGDGGAIFTNSDELAEKLISIRVHGKGTEKYDNIRIGINGRLDTIQAAILLPKLSIFPDEIKARNNVASLYTEKISQLKGELKTPFVPDGYQSAWAQYSLLSENRDQIREHLETSGIPSVIYYPKPLHLQTAFSYLGYKEGDFPITESTSKNIFSLPMNPYLTEKQINYITDVLGKFNPE